MERKVILTIFLITVFLERVSFPIGELNMRISQVFLLLAWLYVLVSNRQYMVHRNTWILAGFLGFLFLSSVAGLFPLFSLKGFFLIALFSSTIPLIGFMTNEEKPLFDRLYLDLSWAGVLFGSFVIFAAIVHKITGIEWLGAETNFVESFSDDIGKGEVVRSYGTFSMATSASVSLASLAFLFIGPAVFDNSKIRKNLLPTFIILLGCVATYSRGFILGFGVGFIYLFYALGVATNSKAKYTRYMMMSAMTLVAGFALIHLLFRNQDWYLAIISKFSAMFDIQTGSGLYRILVWAQLLRDFWSHPLLGNGILYYQLTFHKDANAENFLLEVLSGGGAITTLFFLFFCFTLIKTKYTGQAATAHDVNSISLKAAFVSMFVGFLTNPGFWTHLPWLVMAMILVANGIKDYET